MKVNKLAILFALCALAASSFLQAQSHVESLKCSSVTAALSKTSSESDWADPQQRILGIRTENWNAADFAAAGELTETCRQRACMGSQDTCAMWNESIVPPINRVLNNAPDWIENARLRRAADAAAEAVAIEAEQEAEALRQREAELALQRLEIARSIYQETLNELVALPEAESSLERMESMRLVVSDVIAELPAREAVQLGGQFETAYAGKSESINAALQQQECSVLLAETYLPSAIYANRIWGISAGAVEFDSDFEQFVCTMVRNGYSVEYEDVVWWSSNDHRLIATLGNVVTELMFAEHSSEEAWILSAIDRDDETEELSEEESLQLLLSLTEQ